MSASYLPAAASMWGEEGEGTLTIEVWDGSQIRGTFTFIAEERFVSDPRVVEVSGTFDFVSGVGPAPLAPLMPVTGSR
jgi:hypothetical protein